MDDDAFDERYETHDRMLRRMLGILVRQGEILEEMRSAAQRQDTINERLTVAIEGLEVTQARIETLLTRMVRGETNGREA
jgi:hypothetical protein